MSQAGPSDPAPARRQSLATEEFFYFFLRLRKNEARRIAQGIAERFPDEDPPALARRLTASKANLSLLGGALLHAPLLLPGVGQALKLAGVVGAGSLLTRMHLYLILEIAQVFGEDIEDTARVPEMLAVVAATGLGAAAPSLLARYNLQPLLRLPAGALSMTATTRLIGTAASRLYQARAAARGLDSGEWPAT